MPGSDVEEYVVTLDKLLTQKQDEITDLKNLISKFHTHIKQEQELSQRFYSMQENNAEIEPDLDDY
jgi:peptidoglycan hydrolase CwlO-like protein